MPGITAQACLASVSAEQYVTVLHLSTVPLGRQVHTPLVIPTRANVWTTRARARAFDVWYTADTFLLEMRNLNCLRQLEKSPPKNLHLRKNGRIDFSTLLSMG